MSDPDPTRNRLRALPPASPLTPAARRLADIIAYTQDTDYYPAATMADCALWLHVQEARTGQANALDTHDWAMAAATLGRRDGALAVADDDDDARRASALTFAVAWAAGFGCCLVLVLVGFLLAH